MLLLTLLFSNVLPSANIVWAEGGVSNLSVENRSDDGVHMLGMNRESTSVIPANAVIRFNIGLLNIDENQVKPINEDSVEFWSNEAINAVVDLDVSGENVKIDKPHVRIKVKKEAVITKPEFAASQFARESNVSEDNDYYICDYLFNQLAGGQHLTFPFPFRFDPNTNVKTGDKTVVEAEFLVPEGANETAAYQARKEFKAKVAGIATDLDWDLGNEYKNDLKEEHPKPIRYARVQVKNLTETVLPQGTTQLLRLTPWEYIDLPTEISGRVGYTIPKNVTFKFIFDNDYLDSISGAEKIDDETAISKRVMQWTDTHATVLADGSRVNQPGWFTGHYIYLKKVPLNQEIPIKIEYYINYEEDGQKLLDTKTIYIQLDPVEFRNGGIVRFHRVGDRDWFHGDLARINPEEADIPVESANAKFYAFFNDKLYYIKEDMMNQGMLFSNEIWNENNGSEPGKTNGGMVTEIKEIKAELKSEGEYFKSLIFSSFNGNSEEDKNKAKIMMALTYLNRYYGIEYGDFNIKNMMMFKPDFYAKTPSVIDRLIRIGSQEKNLKGDRTQDAYREIIAGDTGKGDLRSFLDYNMRLFTNDTDLNDWFIHSAKNVYVVEPETTNPDFKNKRHRAFDGLNNNMHARMILPLLNLKKAHIFMISTYNTMAYSSFEKYGKNTEAEREAFKERINYVAKAQQTYLDFWSRLALPNVRDRLLKSQNMVPTPVWDNQAYAGIKDANRRGYGTDGKVATPIRELFGPTDRWHQINWNMGAMAKVYANPYEDEQVFFMVTNMLEDFGISAFTHETTHVNDRMAYLGGHRHRQGTDLEAYAQGMLQTPDKSTSNGEYGALGINMAYHRPNDGNQWYNPDPDKLQTREQIDHYMKNYNDALMMLDHLEADAVLPQLNGNTSRWFKKMDRQYRSGNSGHQFDKIRELTDDEKKVAINTIDDLITNNLMTKHGAPGDDTYNPTDFRTAYVNMNMMTGIYGGNTSTGAPGAASFKHNTFRMWGYFGYENGFVGYASSKYQGAADKENNKLLGDDFIIKKVSNNRFSTLEEWKKAYYQEVKAKADKGFTAIEIDGKQITNYAELKVLFDKAVEADLAGGGTAKTVELKSKVFKALLKNTDGFSGQLFNP